MNQVYHLTQKGKQKRVKGTIVLFLLVSIFICLPINSLLSYYVLKTTFKVAILAAGGLSLLIFLYGWLSALAGVINWKLQVKEHEIILSGAGDDIRIPRHKITKIIETDEDLEIKEMGGSVSSGFDIPKSVERYEELRAILDTWKSIEKENRNDKEVVLSTRGDSMMTISEVLTLSNNMEFMRIPAGEFVMGSIIQNKFAGSDEYPQHMVDIPYDFWMARFPVTNELFYAYVQSKRIDHPVPRWEQKKDHPVTFVKWADAMDYCKWLNELLKAELPPGLVLRLPTEAEWEKAARGTDGREYPWGNEFDKQKCNTVRSLSKSLLGSFVNDTISVSKYSPQGDSPYGCSDMSGNVREWTHSLKKGYPYNPNDGREDNLQSNVSRVMRGGAFSDYEGEVRCAVRLLDKFNRSGDDIGFRIVIAPSLPYK